MSFKNNFRDLQVFKFTETSLELRLTFRGWGSTYYWNCCNGWTAVYFLFSLSWCWLVDEKSSERDQSVRVAVQERFTIASPFYPDLKLTRKGFRFWTILNGIFWHDCMLENGNEIIFKWNQTFSNNIACFRYKQIYFKSFKVQPWHRWVEWVILVKSFQQLTI